MCATKFIALGILFILCASSISCQEEAAPLTIEPFRLTIEVGNDAVFSCKLAQPTNFSHFSWFYPDLVTEVEPESNTTRVYVDAESNLHIKSALENDTGTYLCQVTVHNSSNTIPLVTFTSSTTTMRSDVTVTQPQGSNSTDFGVTSTTDSPSSTVLAEKNPGPRAIQREILEVYNATVSLTVYVMPTYFTEGMIILGINLGLLLIFLICLTRSLVSEKKRMQMYNKK